MTNLRNNELNNNPALLPGVLLSSSAAPIDTNLDSFSGMLPSSSIAPTADNSTSLNSTSLPDALNSSSTDPTDANFDSFPYGYGYPLFALGMAVAVAGVVVGTKSE